MLATKRHLADVELLQAAVNREEFLKLRSLQFELSPTSLHVEINNNNNNNNNKF
jgi:hypothetical protein